MSGPEEISQRMECLVVHGDVVETSTRFVIREKPLRIVVNGACAVTLMCTPEAETELALGYLVTEGLLRAPDKDVKLAFSRGESPDAPSEVRVELPGVTFREATVRDREKYSSGALGQDPIQAVRENLPAFQRPAGRLRPEDVFRLRDAMEAAQSLFRQTGGSHAAALALIPVGGQGSRPIIREDLGRHNALDKVVGAAVKLGLPLERALLFLSGRLSVEMISKVARGGIADVAGVSAPSAAGVALAQRLAMFLAGFVRGESMTVYSGADALAMGRGA